MTKVMKRLTFKSFLSHRYKSPEVNLYFFDLFDTVAEIQFEVDEGSFTTNVTRLERMVRDADAFIGLYPFAGSDSEANNLDELKKQSRYFRLEIDLAIRSQKPGIIFYDKRFGDLLRPPASIFSFPFDFKELIGGGGFPSFNKHKKIFEGFCQVVKRKKDLDDCQLPNEKSCVGIISSPSHENEAATVDGIMSKLRDHNYDDITVIKWPFTLNSALFKTLDKLDFAVVSLTEEVLQSGVPAYLHGRFIPSIRLRKKSEAEGNRLMSFLYDGVEVGYMKDIVHWENIESLSDGLSQKLALIKNGVTRISTHAQARNYFSAAALRKEAVFLSYSGKDLEVAKKISTELKKRFQKVFDYRDGESIQPGASWLPEIFNQLSASVIGISLLSEDYLKSGHCLQELQQMVAHRNDGKLKLFPIKLPKDPIQIPTFLSDMQYVRLSEFNSIEEMILKAIQRNL